MKFTASPWLLLAPELVVHLPQCLDGLDDRMNAVSRRCCGRRAWRLQNLERGHQAMWPLHLVFVYCRQAKIRPETLQVLEDMHCPIRAGRTFCIHTPIPR